MKEAKHEETLKQLDLTWTAVDFVMSFYKDTDVPLLRLEDETIETLESDQMAVQVGIYKGVCIYKCVCKNPILSSIAYNPHTNNA